MPHFENFTDRSLEQPQESATLVTQNCNAIAIERSVKFFKMRHFLQSEVQIILNLGFHPSTEERAGCNFTTTQIQWRNPPFHFSSQSV